MISACQTHVAGEQPIGAQGMLLPAHFVLVPGMAPSKSLFTYKCRHLSKITERILLVSHACPLPVFGHFVVHTMEAEVSTSGVSFN